jgi:hypothetical protein
MILYKHIIPYYSMTDQIIKEPDIITKEPENEIKIKDPKKVAAGKKLAEYHKKAKKALEAENSIEPPPEESGKSWMPEMSLPTVISIVGISLTAFDLYMRWKKANLPTAPVVVPTLPKAIEPTAVKAKTGME